MAGKIVLGLALLAGAALAFIAGLIAPEALRGPLKAWAAPLDRAWVAASTSLAAPAAAAASATTAASGTAGSTAGTAPSSVASAVPSSQLQLAPVVTANTRYALQAGQFAVESQAQTLAASLRDRGASVSVFNSQDKGGLLWAIVAIGSYASSDEALRQRPQVQALLDAPVALAVIALPAPAALVTTGASAAR